MVDLLFGSIIYLKKEEEEEEAEAEEEGKGNLSFCLLAQAVHSTKQKGVQAIGIDFSEPLYCPWALQYILRLHRTCLRFVEVRHELIWHS